MTLLDRFRLDGKTALVTGASRGIGRAIATGFAEAGADLILVGRDIEALGAAAENLRKLGGHVYVMAADFGVPVVAEEACQRILEEIGTPDILVNNVGGRRVPTPLVEQSTQEWQQMLDLNLTGTFVALREIGKALLAAGKTGRIINIASMNALAVNPDIGGRHYETSKAAVLQLTRAAAVDWAKAGITVNAICPGLVMTEANEAWQKTNPQVIEQMIARTPSGRAIAVEDVAALALYLASPAAGAVTGGSFYIDGGYTLV